MVFVPSSFLSSAKVIKVMGNQSLFFILLDRSTSIIQSIPFTAAKAFSQSLFYQKKPAQTFFFLCQVIFFFGSNRARKWVMIPLQKKVEETHKSIAKEPKCTRYRKSFARILSLLDQRCETFIERREKTFMRSGTCQNICS